MMLSSDLMEFYTDDINFGATESQNSMILNITDLHKKYADLDQNTAKNKAISDAESYYQSTLFNPQSAQHNTDILHNCGVMFFEKKIFKKALEFFSAAIKISDSYHCFYHYVGSAVYFNRGHLNAMSGNVVQALKDFEHSEFLYHQNEDAISAIKMLKDLQLFHTTQNQNEEAKKTITTLVSKFNLQNPNSCALQSPPFLSDLYIFEASKVISECEIINKEIANEGICGCEKRLPQYSAIIAEIDRQHFDYHVVSARQYFNRAMCFEKLGREDVAIADYKKSLEFDKKNPDNPLILGSFNLCQNRIASCYY